jgi:4'-phosphopantetheinyl transferase
VRIPEPGSLGAPEQVQVWWASLDAEPIEDDDRAALVADLDPATLAKVARYHRAEDRDRALAGHVLLRRLLAAVVGGRPAGLVLRTRCAGCGRTDHGKPYLDTGGPTPPVEVNLSHSGPVVAVALAPAGSPVGVDVEHRRKVDWAALRRSVFADEEWAVAEAAAEPDRRRTDLWSRKEAAVKSSGHGLALSLRAVVITGGSGGAAGWTSALPGGAGATRGWDLGLRPDVAGAVAVHEAPGVSPKRPGLERPDVRMVTFR